MHLKPAKNAGPAHQPEEIAVAILAWLGEEPDMLTRFLSLSGLEASSLRQFSRSPGFSAALMEFVMAHEPSLMAFSAHSGIPPASIAAAWQALSGPYYGGTGA
ncbi:DUF3572 domain-containing protein [Rhizobium sp. C1]|uniref:DUF3572 domain-containing protein n=1 Tax=Rhizobium sp. C1 TaxID=1349799 RepID=UPI001E5CEB32|nr:DUF3572 domain-containing protein [Rhizobium sp. C1]MCD2177116.1 DUF3572 domain-containing protein [Rhizobium sp. C1]